MAKEKVSGIYCIENLVNGKRYIGQSVNINFRLYIHKNNLNKNTHFNDHLQKSWNKNGEDCFKFYIVEKCTVENLNELEIKYIKRFNTINYGYNNDSGGNVNFVKSRESKIKNRLSAKSFPIYQIDFNGNIINEWYGARTASKELNIKQNCIWECLNNNRKTYKNYIWIYVKEYDDSFDFTKYINKNTQKKPIIQYDLNMNFIKEWESANASTNSGFDNSCVIKCCKGKNKHHKGFIFKYKDLQCN